MSDSPSPILAQKRDALRRAIAFYGTWFEMFPDAKPDSRWIPDALRAVLADLEQNEWRTMESAPHETEVLLYCPERGITNHARIELGCASSGWERNGVSNISRHAWATHWRPLPPPPVLANTSEPSE